MHVRFFYDVVCPYAYLASTQIEQLAKEIDTEIEWVPMLLGGVFKSIDAPQVPATKMTVPKAKMNTTDLYRWSERWQVPFQFSKYHPQRTVEAMRLLCITPPNKRPQVSMRLFQSYWTDQQRLDLALLESIAREFDLLEVWRDNLEKAKSILFENTALAVSLGIFGAPVLAVNHNIFWGQDRLNLARTALGSQPKPIKQGQAPTGSYVEVFHDFSSPFSYLGCQHIERLVKERGAEIKWKPMLLGALFQSIGAPNVPLFEMNKPKRQYMGKDLTDWAQYWGVNFQFPKTFPLRTVKALRLALVEPRLTQAIYHRAWHKGDNIGDEEVLHDLIQAEGYDPTYLLTLIEESDIKERLRENTAAAQKYGAFGAPSFILHRPHESPQLFWGQDRIELLCEALVSSSSSSVKTLESR